VVASPLTGRVRGLNGLISGLALQLGQIAEQRAAEAPEPKPEEGVQVHEPEASDAQGPTPDAPEQPSTDEDKE